MKLSENDIKKIVEIITTHASDYYDIESTVYDDFIYSVQQSLAELRNK